MLLTGVRIGGSLGWAGAKVANAGWVEGSGGGPAVRAADLVVGEDLTFTENFSASGGGDDGVIHLTGARTGGQLVLGDATVTGDGGPAVYADGLSVGQDLYLMRLTAAGVGEEGVLILTNTQVSGWTSSGTARRDMRPSRINTSPLPSPRPETTIVPGTC
jgi:hypothetical protein